MNRVRVKGSTFYFNDEFEIVYAFKIQQDLFRGTYRYLGLLGVTWRNFLGLKKNVIFENFLFFLF
jgi:hypothetical protein